MEHKKLCFIGAGNMTRSIVSGLVASGYPANFIEATNPSNEKLALLKQDFAINTSNDNLTAAENADVILLCVKPQLMEEVCQQLQSIDVSNKLIITIAAGVLAKRYQDYFAQDIRLIRGMPNTPTQIGYGMTGLWASDNISQIEKDLAETIMSTGGKVVWVNNENDLNMVIALAGSSPAYFFLLIESMINAAKNMGMDEIKARDFAQQAALGAAQMVIQNPQLSVETLRHNVTSKGGTTAEAISTFEHANLPKIVEQAMDNCIKRAQEMSTLF